MRISRAIPTTATYLNKCNRWSRRLASPEGTWRYQKLSESNFPALRPGLKVEIQMR